MLEEIVAFMSEELEIPAEKIKEKTKFSDLNMDSLDMIDFIFALEKRFHVEINDRTIKSVKTVGGLARYMEEITKR